jgi:type IX secretion system PorP/SprF family membrane protein
MNKIYILITCIILAFYVNTKGQDYHFSQFEANPLFINPALTGERLTYNKGIHLNANYRDQMAEFTSGPGAYKTIAIGADVPLNARVSSGGYLYNDNSAGGAFRSTGFMLSGAYNLIAQTSEASSNQNLSVGLQMGAFNRSIQPDNFTYANQYSYNSADGFDRSLPSGETFAQQSDFNFNMNFGIYYRVSGKNKRLSVFSGFSIYNISKSNESFLGLYSPAALRINLHGGALYRATDDLTIVPQFLYMNQANANQLNVNVLLFSKLNGTKYEPLLGVGFRNNESVIFQLGLRYEQTTFKLSYDIVTNYTKVYRNRGLEFSLVYTFAKAFKASAKGNGADLSPESSVKPN